EPLVRAMLAESGVDVDDETLRTYLIAEHAAWAPARRPASMSVALLDALRGRGLKTGLVSNSMDPPWILLRDLEEQELAERLDAVVFSSEIGVRIPRPEIFQAALERLPIPAELALVAAER